MSSADVERQYRRFRRISALVTWMPRWLARFFAKFRTRWVISSAEFGRVRGIVAKNLEPVLPPGADCEAAAERLLRNYGMFLMDYFRMPAMKPSWRDSMFWPMKGTEHVEGALAGKKGVILATAHLGCWELGGVAMRFAGHEVTAVGVPDPANEAISRWRDEVRRSHGLEVLTIAPGQFVPFDVVRALEANRVVCMLADRNFVEADPVELDFFGRKAQFPRGPAVLSMLTGAPILPAFVTMGAKGRYEAVIHEPIRVPEPGTKQERLEATMQALIRVFEAKIRANPEQWYVFDPFWDRGEPVSNIARGAAGLEGGVAPLK